MSQRKHLAKTGETDRLELLATRIRKNAIDNITKSGVGHPGGSLSISDILAVLYFGKTHDPQTGSWETIMRYDPSDPLWPNRDRLVLSKGHAAPALYATLAEAGFFSKDVLKIYKKIDSPLQGHPAMLRVFSENGTQVEQGTPGVDFSTGSLGHGLSAAAGMALNSKIYGYNYNVYVILGEGDLQEGMLWEACLSIPNKKLNNICAIVDYNGLQVDGCCDDINSLDPLDQKFKAFNWDVRVIDGHDFYAIVDVLDYFKQTRSENAKPLLIVANTVKGKGVPEHENECVFHAVPLPLAECETAEKEFSAKIENLEKNLADYDGTDILTKPLDKLADVKEKKQDLAEIIRQNPVKTYADPIATRIGYGNCVLRLGEYEKIFVLNADLMGACGVTEFCGKYPEDAKQPNQRRSMNVGVQEANMMTMGAALASCGKIPVVNSFGIFSTGRAWEMVRQDISYPRLNVKIIGSHTGIALGEYGVSHQAVEDVGCMRVLPHLTIIEPSDALQADLLFEKVLQHEGPVYYRVGRNPTPLFYTAENAFGITPVNEFEIGKGIKVKDGDDITLICSGPILEEALKVARDVKQSVRVIDMPTIRPIDGQIIEEAAKETGRICTIQDHYKNGGLNEEVLHVLAAKELTVKFDSVATTGYAESGSRDDLYEKYGLSANQIIKKLKLIKK
jgi:transketolase